jgi:hypothetical protein
MGLLDAAEEGSDAEEDGEAEEVSLDSPDLNRP